MYQEDNDSGYGTAATLAGLAALASPMGRQVRQAGKNLYMNHFGSPFGNFEGLREGLGQIGGVLRKDVARGTGGLSELGARAFNTGSTERAEEKYKAFNDAMQKMNAETDPTKKAALRQIRDNIYGAGKRDAGFSLDNTKQDARDTWNMLRDTLRSVGTMAQGTPGAIKNRSLIPEVTATALSKDKVAALAEFFKNHPVGKRYNPDEQKLIENFLGQTDSPLEAALLLEKMRAAQV